MYGTHTANRHAHRRLEAELIETLRLHGKPASIETLFEGLRPLWVIEAVERLIVAGRLTEDADGTLRLVG